MDLSVGEIFGSGALSAKIAVVIPAYKVTKHILEVISLIPASVSQIYVVDDACPDGSGKLVEGCVVDARVKVLYHPQNRGVGGAVITGYLEAIRNGAQVIVKVDGDGQMDPGLIPQFTAPIIANEADYTKGNRFFDLEKVRMMPRARLMGNAVLSLLSKLSTGYWDLFDPTNGYTAIHAKIAGQLPYTKISQGYFFETDMLFRLNTFRAVVVDVPMDARYADEVSNLKISTVIGEFAFKHLRNFFKRILYNYYLRDLSLASIELPLGIIMFFFGLTFGVYHWLESALLGKASSAGTVMLSALPVLMGIQLVLAFLAYDISSVPKRPRHMQL
jgi:glycosyltransferase involved in cell wall biosynthesis